VATIEDLNAVMADIAFRTGDANAWMQGLSADDMAATKWLIASPAELDALIAKIRANHPTLFGPRAAGPAAPTAQPEADRDAEQRGVAAEAMKKAEDDLANQNSSTAQLDLLVVSAILNAHTATVQGAEQLRRLQNEIGNAVSSRTDLDTPAGARDFQRFLIGKLRQIGAVVETTSLDATSKAGLAGAWTALYESTRSDNSGPSPAQPPAPATPPGSAANVPAGQLPGYGADFAGTPLDDPWLTGDPALLEPIPDPRASAPGQPPLAPPMMPMMPSPPAGGGFAGGGLPPATAAPAPMPRFDDEPNTPGPTHRTDSAGGTLDELLAEAERMDEADTTPDAEVEDRDGDNADAGSPTEPATAEQSTPSTVVRLPNGDTVTAPTPQLAGAIRAAIAGTPIGAAFHEQGIVIPPPGTAVPNPVDPARLMTGDIGMFTDRQALALDSSRALFNGKIQPVTSVSGPSFLGWLHPGSGAAAPAAPSSTTPNGAEAPPPTRPADVAGHAR
jgi:hypothetical protein